MHRGYSQSDFDIANGIQTLLKKCFKGDMFQPRTSFPNGIVTTFSTKCFYDVIKTLEKDVKNLTSNRRPLPPRNNFNLMFFV